MVSIDHTKRFSALLADFGILAAMTVVADESGAAIVEFDDGVFLHIVHGGGDALVVFADTGFELSSLPPESFVDLAEIFLKINFITSLSSRLTVAVSPEGNILVSYADQISRLDGTTLFNLVEEVLDKTRVLRDLIREVVDETSDEGGSLSPGDLGIVMGKFV